MPQDTCVGAPSSGEKRFQYKVVGTNLANTANIYSVGEHDWLYGHPSQLWNDQTPITNVRF